MKFICPECGSSMLEVVMTDCNVSETMDITDSDNVVYGTPQIDDCYNDRYQCAKCGWRLPVEPNLLDNDPLFEWLEKQEYNKRGKRNE